MTGTEIVEFAAIINGAFTVDEVASLLLKLDRKFTDYTTASLLFPRQLEELVGAASRLSWIEELVSEVVRERPRNELVLRFLKRNPGWDPTKNVHFGQVLSKDDAKVGGWQILKWDEIEDGYLTSIANHLLNDLRATSITLPLGDRTIKIDLMSSVSSDEIVTAQLRSDLNIQRALVDTINSYRFEITEDALGKFKPGFESALKRKTTELDQCTARLRATLQALSRRVFVRIEDAEQSV